MRLLVLGIVLCSTLCIAQDADVARVGTGSELLDTCTRVAVVKTLRDDNTDDWIHDKIVTGMASGACYGFIKAVKQLGEIGGQFCPSDTITYGQEQKIVLKYLNDHPEKLHLPSTFLVREAFRGAFPCPTKKAKAHPTATSH
jgi:Rap1a immunity proteins